MSLMVRIYEGPTGSAEFYMHFFPQGCHGAASFSAGTIGGSRQANAADATFEIGNNTYNTT
jgi:hypothetical protein